VPDNYSWFKLWHEVRTDAKLRALTGDQHRVWLHLLIFASEQLNNRGAITGFDDELLAVEVADGDVALLTATIERLIKFRILAQEQNGYRFTNFNKRQADNRKPSDQPDETRRRQQESRAKRRDDDGENDGENTSHAVSRGVTPLSRGVTPQEGRRKKEEGEEELEREQEPETPGGGEGGGDPPRARARKATPPAILPTTTATGALSGALSPDVTGLCERIATRTHLPPRPDVMEQLAGVLMTHMARGLSPGDIERGVWNLIDPSRPKHIKRPDVTKINNWLTYTHAAEREDTHGPNGPNNTRRPVAAGAGGGRRAALIPDPTNNGRYAHLVTVASDDDPDEE
jgi:hypothetical protein